MDKSQLRDKYEGIGIDELRAKLYQHEARDAKRIEYRKNIQTQLDAAGAEYELAEKDSPAKKTASGKKARWSTLLKVINLTPLSERSQSATRGKNAADLHIEIVDVRSRLTSLEGAPESTLTVSDMKFMWKEGPAQLATLRPRYKKLTGRTWEPDATDHAHVVKDASVPDAEVE